ncbi:PAS domain S-box protein [Nucisporomicrobium flavum]|uniref:PAS domain S-box protein n=1 Tax=Nucisporomicrobium flavum TaxID=2785915 RepID=UPI001F21B7C3|nr:PAS domain S-box protein [Nucisporomicrobium flavum]
MDTDDAPGGPHSDSLFEQLLDAAPDATVGVDRAGSIVFVNAQALRLFGYRRDELLGEPIEILVPDDMTRAHRGLRKKYSAAATHRAIGSGNPLHARRKDGSVFPAEISLSGLQAGTGLIVSAAVRDITDRLHAEAERARLREEAERAKLQNQLQHAQRIESLGQLAGGIDLLLTDVIMPHLLGTTLAEQVTALHPGTRVLFMSGYATPVLAARGTLDPAVTLLEKPFTRDELCTAVHQALR